MSASYDSLGYLMATVSSDRRQAERHTVGQATNLLKTYSWPSHKFTKTIKLHAHDD